MSSRSSVTRERIEQFLRALGDRFRKSGRIYLVGGTTIVFEGLRNQSLDIDLTYQIDNRDHDAFLKTIRELKDQLGINVEEASPADFIPLPSGADDRAIFVGRFGQLDVFHFDLYSTALSKIERGSEEDFDDALALVRTKRIELSRLETYFEEIRPKLMGASLKQDPIEFEKKMEHFRRMLREKNPL